MRISIIGQPGSGKSTLAQKISDKLNIPYFQLDRFYLEAGGAKIKRGNSQEKERVRAYMKEKVLEFVNQDSWVSDGSYFKLQSIVAEKADVIIFLNISLFRRVLNHLHRMFTTKRHVETNVWDDVKLIFRTIKLTPLRHQKFKKFLVEYGDKVKILKNYKDVERYFNAISLL